MQDFMNTNKNSFLVQAIASAKQPIAPTYSEKAIAPAIEASKSTQIAELFRTASLRAIS
jgi:hypothetical protein